MCVQGCYAFWMANIAHRGVTSFTGIHFSLGSFMTYSLKVPHWANIWKYCQELGYTFVL